MKIHQWAIEAMPDPRDRGLAAASGGDIKRRALRASLDLLRVAATLPANSVRLGFRIAFEPNAARTARSLVSIVASGSDESVGAIDVVLTRGVLSALYAPRVVGTSDRLDLPNGVAACYDIVRREDAIKPPVARRQENPNTPERYYRGQPLEARDDNDWVALDRCLAGMKSVAVVEIVVSPTSVVEERQVHAQYLRQLTRANRRSEELAERPLRVPDGIEVVHPPQLWDATADDVRRDEEAFHRTLSEPHLHFSVRVWSGSTGEAAAIAACVAEAGLNKGRYRLLRSTGEDQHWERLRNASETVSVLDEPLAPDVWDGHGAGLASLCRFPRLATVDGLKGLCRLPVGPGHAGLSTMRLQTDTEIGQGPGPAILIGDDIEGSRAPERAWEGKPSVVFGPHKEGSEVRWRLSLATKHVSVFGLQGSGKTNALFNLLVQLGTLPTPIPFLVLVPVKREFRALPLLVGNPVAEIQVFARGIRYVTPGNDRVSPLRFNPMAYPEGITAEEHVGHLREAFRAAMPLIGPLDALLADALEDVYGHLEPGRRFPRLSDLLKVALRMARKQGYAGEVESNLRAALRVRVGSLTRGALGRVFDCETPEPGFEDLYSSNTIVEMDALSTDQARFLSLLLLTSQREYIRTTRHAGQGLSHVTVIEEAHVVVGRSADNRAREDAPDPGACAAEFVARDLAELRALGEGVAIVDQLPSAVAPEVIKSTATKLAFCLLDPDDRERLGNTMLMSSGEMEELARLEPGECFFFTQGQFRPRRVQSLAVFRYLGSGGANARDVAEGLPDAADDRAFAEMLERMAWYQESEDARLHESLLEGERLADAVVAGMKRAEVQLSRGRRLAVAQRGGVARAEDPERLKRAMEASRGDLMALREVLVVKARGLPHLAEISKKGGELPVRAVHLRFRIGTELLPQLNCAIENLGRTAHRLGQFGQPAARATRPPEVRE